MTDFEKHAQQKVETSIIRYVHILYPSFSMAVQVACALIGKEGEHRYIRADFWNQT